MSKARAPHRCWGPCSFVHTVLLPAERQSQARHSPSHFLSHKSTFPWWCWWSSGPLMVSLAVCLFSILPFHGFHRRSHGEGCRASRTRRSSTMVPSALCKCRFHRSQLSLTLLCAPGLHPRFLTRAIDENVGLVACLSTLRHAAGADR